jgi:hypothetical protein
MACKSCKSDKPIKNVQLGVIILGLYFFSAAIYGTVEIVKDIISFFK